MRLLSAWTDFSDVFVEDPLWGGEGCGRFSTCCEGERKPWFFKNLTQPVTSDIEVRVCTDEARRHRSYLHLCTVKIFSKL